MRARIFPALIAASLPALAWIALAGTAPPQYRLVIADALARGWPVIWATAALLPGSVATCAMLWQRKRLSSGAACVAVSPLAAAVLCWWSVGGFAISLLPAILLILAITLGVLLANRRSWLPKPLTTAWRLDATAVVVVIAIFLGFAIASTASPIIMPRTVGSLAILAVFLGCAGSLLCAATFHPRIGAALGGWWLLAAFVLAPNDHRARTSMATAEPVGVEQALREWLANRRDLGAYRAAHMPYPVIFVSSEGGGIYAAAHAHAVLSTLAARCPTFSQHVLVTVGVSGGAVGNVLFHTASDPRQKPASPCAPGTTHLDQTALTADHLSPVIARMLLLETLDSFLPGQWITRDRGGVLVDSFRASLANGRSPEILVGRSFDPASARPAVAAVTTNMATGGRLVLSPIVAEDSSAEWFPQTVPGARDTDILEAAGMSARFPWVTPTAQLPLGDDGSRILADGGYFENSGAETVLDFIQALRMAEAREIDDERLGNLPSDPVCRIHVARNMDAPAEWQGCAIHIFPIHLAITTTGTGNEEELPAEVAQSFLLDPLMTLISTRSARGRLALLRAQQDQCGTGGGAFCVANPEATSGFFMSQISPADLQLPLGWFIRQREASDIAKEAVPAEIFGYRATEEVVESDIGLLILHLDQALWAPVKPPATMRRIDVYRGGP